MKKRILKKLTCVSLAAAMVLALTACGGQANETADENVESAAEPDAGESAAATSETAGNVNYKGKVNYVDIAKQLQADQTVDLNGLSSEKYSITGYAQGYDFDDAWMGSITQMASSGCEVILGSGSSDFAFNFGGVDRSNSEVKVGGVDSLTPAFQELLDGGVYTFCAGSYPSMIAPAYAAVLRALEGNKLIGADGNPASVGMSHWIATSSEELADMIANDCAGNYAVDTGLFSELLTCDYDKFMELTENIDYETMMANKAAYADAEKVSLGKAYKIGILLNDTTSDESLAYQEYAKYLAEEFGFTVTFSESTGGAPTEETNQIQTWASAGYDAVVSMSSGSIYDQADLCGSTGMLLEMYAVHPMAEDKADLDSLESYCGAVGPTTYNEAEVGYKLGKYYIEQGYTKYAIFGGSIAFGAETHAYRVAGILAAMIEDETGVVCEDFNDGTTVAASSEAADKKMKIGVSLWFTEADMGSESRKMLDKAAEVLGIELEYIDHGFDPEVVGSVVDTFCEDGCQGIIFNNPSDTDMTAAIDTCEKNGVYLVQAFKMIDQETNPEIYEKAKASEYCIGGVHENESKNGEQLVNILLDNGYRNIGLVGWSEDDALWQGRLKGYEAGVDAWNKEHPDDQAAFCGTLYSEGSEETAGKAVTELMDTYPEMDAVIGEPIQGILSAIEKEGRTGEIGYVSTDFQEDLGERLENGSITGQSGGHYADPLFSLMLLYNAIEGNYTDIAGEYVDITFPYLYIDSVEAYGDYEKYFVERFPYTEDEIREMSEYSVEKLAQTAENLSVQDAAERAGS